MKAFHLAALFGGAAIAVQPLVGRADGITTIVVYATLTETVMSCPGAFSHGPESSSSGAMLSSSALGTNPPVATNTLSDSVPTLFPPGVSSSAYLPPFQSSVLSGDPSRSVDFSVSLISPNPSLPNTNTDSVPTSSPPGPSGLSSAYEPPAQTSGVPVDPSSSDAVIIPGPSPSSPAPVTGSLTDSVPTSFPPGASASGSSTGYLPPRPSSGPESASNLPTTGTNTDAVPTSGGPASSGIEGSSAPSSTATEAVPTSGYSGTTDSPSSRPYTPSVPGVTDAVPTSATINSSAGPGVSSTQTTPILTATDATPSSGSPISSSGPSSGGYLPPISSNTDVAPTSGQSGSSIDPSSSESDSATASNPPSASSLTLTDVAPTSGYPGSSVVPSGGASQSPSPSNTATDAVPTSGYPGPSDAGSASSAASTDTNTDSVPTSFDPSSSGPSSGGYTVPKTTTLPTDITSSAPQGYPSGPSTTQSSGSWVTVSGTYPAITSVTSDLMYPGVPSSDATTVPVPTSDTTNTITDAGSTSRGTGYTPSGTGSPYPSGVNGTNGTIVPPSPSYIEVPVNKGQIVAVGQGLAAAIVIALAFALFA